MPGAVSERGEIEPVSTSAKDGPWAWAGAATLTQWQSISILSLALVLRAAWGLLVPVAPVSDCAMYDTFARNMAAGHGYVYAPGSPQTAYWPVGATALFAACYALFGVSYGPIVVLNVALGVGIVWLTMLLARRWFGPSAALWSGLIVALQPTLIAFTTVLASELPFTFLLLAILLIYDAETMPVWARGCVGGVLVALAAYLRPVILPLPPVLAVLQVSRGGWKSVPRSAIQLAATLGVALLFILPWTYRNWREMGEPALISTNGGPNLWMGNNPNSTGLYMSLPERVAGMSELERSRVLRSEAVDYIRAHPGAFITRTLRKLLILYDRESIGVVWNRVGLERRLPERAIDALKWGANAYFWALLGLGLVGLVVLCTRCGSWRILLHPVMAISALFSAIYAVTVVQDRYHLPTLPLLAMLAAIAVCGMQDLARRSRRRFDSMAGRADLA